jgi:hypothetical protein
LTAINRRLAVGRHGQQFDQRFTRGVRQGFQAASKAPRFLHSEIKRVSFQRKSLA